MPRAATAVHGNADCKSAANPVKLDQAVGRAVCRPTDIDLRLESRVSLPPTAGHEAPEASPIAPSNFLTRLLPADLRALEAIGAAARFSRGEYVYRAGEAGDDAYVLRTGQVKIHQLSLAGREVILWFCLPGEIFGLAEATRGGPRAVSAQACVGSEVLAVPRPAFQRLLAQRPEVAFLTMQVLSARMRILGEIFVNLVSDDVATRIAKLIVRLAAQYGARAGKDIVLDIPLTHQEIADMVGTSRQTVTSALSALNRQGVLSINHRRICIQSPELLSGLAREST